MEETCKSFHVNLHFQDCSSCKHPEFPVVANPTLREVRGDSPKNLWEQESYIPVQEPLCFLVTEKLTRVQLLSDLQSDIQISYKE